MRPVPPRPRWSKPEAPLLAELRQKRRDGFQPAALRWDPLGLLFTPGRAPGAYDLGDFAVFYPDRSRGLVREEGEEIVVRIP